jgi:DNA-directed RNA polymerase specialized sigma24 family protein
MAQPRRIEELPHDELMRRLREGDEWAFAELKRRTEPAVRPAASVSGNEPTLRGECGTSDMVQATYLKLWWTLPTSAHRFPTQEDVERYLCQIARNCRRDWRAKRLTPRGERRELALDDVLRNAAAAPEEDPYLDEWEQLRRYLPSDVYQVIELQAEGRSLEEIARITGQKADTLRKKRSRALEAFRRRRGL